MAQSRPKYAPGSKAFWTRGRNNGDPVTVHVVLDRGSKMFGSNGFPGYSYACTVDDEDGRVLVLGENVLSTEGWVDTDDADLRVFNGRVQRKVRS